MQYKVVEKYSCEDLEEEVNKLIKSGWKPQGGLMVSRNNYNLNAPCFRQAMIREE